MMNAPFSSLRGSSASVDKVIAYLKACVADGRLSPGQKLVEADICNSLDLKRGPVREGLRMLAGQGVLELIPNRGAWVRKLDRQALADMVQTLACLNAGALFSAIRKNDEQMLAAQLEPIMAAMRHAKAERDYLLLTEKIENYHRAVIDLSGNPYLTYLLESLHVYHYRRSMAAELKVENWDLYLSGYEEAHEAALARDFPKAVMAFEVHSQRLQAALAREPAVF